MSLRTECAIEPDDPIDELATLFARGVIRHHEQHLRMAELSPESGVHGLALCSTSRPCVVSGPTSPFEGRGKDD